MDSNKKKELLSQYKERTIAGGVYVIRNTINGKLFVEGTTDLRGKKNRFEFSQKLGSCVNIRLQKDLLIYGSDAFIFEVLEEVDKKALQTPVEFAEDVAFLKSLWLEKLCDETFY